MSDWPEQQAKLLAGSISSLLREAYNRGRRDARDTQPTRELWEEVEEEAAKQTC